MPTPRITPRVTPRPTPKPTPKPVTPAPPIQHPAPVISCTTALCTWTNAWADGATVVWYLDGPAVGTGGSTLNISTVGSGPHSVYMSAVRAGVPIVYSNVVFVTKP
jgi:hypothetical protein